jgi:hypothetical protein
MGTEQVKDKRMEEKADWRASMSIEPGARGSRSLTRKLTRSIGVP